MIVIGIDPGSKESGFVVWDGKQILDKGIYKNEILLKDVRSGYFLPNILVVEGVQNIGKIVGADIFKTCYFIGRLLEADGIPIESQAEHIVYRKDVKLWLCGTVRAKDKDIRKALLDMLGTEVTKDVSSHIWSALAVAVYYYQNFTSAANLKKKEILEWMKNEKDKRDVGGKNVSR